MGVFEKLIKNNNTPRIKYNKSFNEYITKDEYYDTILLRLYTFRGSKAVGLKKTDEVSGESEYYMFEAHLKLLERIKKNKRVDDILIRSILEYATSEKTLEILNCVGDEKLTLNDAYFSEELPYIGSVDEYGSWYINSDFVKKIRDDAIERLGKERFEEKEEKPRHVVKVLRKGKKTDYINER